MSLGVRWCADPAYERCELVYRGMVVLGLGRWAGDGVAAWLDVELLRVLAAGAVGGGGVGVWSGY